MTRQIVVEKHGGTIEVNSKLGQGTEFAIAIPIGVLYEYLLNNIPKRSKSRIR
ncbi:MAG: hypothetical protein HXY43_10620 [Fischerella sp.]|nr:hypothetical protein [Fischerella sp.]